MKNNKTSLRIFFALLPDRATVDAINYHANQFSPGTGKKVRPENFHITLLFLGDVTHKTVDALCLDCDDISLPPFELLISTPGWWKKAGILWLAPETVPPPLTSLHDTLRTLAVRRKLAPENRRFTPHVTLMRKVITAPQYPVIKPFAWSAEAFSLMQSTNSPAGVKYTELAAWPLQS